MILLLLSACLLPPEAIDARLDADGDGFEDAALGGTDCNDDDPSINPDATELCEDLDRDCDGKVGTADADNDGFPGCEECDDDNPSINPDAQEVCDDAGVDEDCDGLVNDADDSVNLSTGTEFFVDNDGDGEGSLNEGPVRACELQEGLAASNDDCDDTDPFIPMPHEWCRNGLDDDCTGGGSDRECGALILVDDLTASVTGAVSSELGRGITFLPDVTGDGIDDFAVGAPEMNQGRGEVYVFSGAQSGVLERENAFAVLQGAKDGDYAGIRLAVGDADLDGEPEFLVSMAGADLLEGSGAWFVSELDLVEGETRSLSYGLPHIRGHKAGSIPWLGGLSAIIATPDAVVVGFVPGFGDQGRVGGFTQGITGAHSIDTADWAVASSTNFFPVAGALQYVDLDGDGVEDLVGAPQRGSSLGFKLGPFTGVETGQYDSTFTKVEQTAVGRSSAVGDFDNDGSPELAFTSVDSNLGQPVRVAHLWILDDLAGAPTEDWHFKGAPDLGATPTVQGLAMADVDDDGGEDLIWGMPTGGVVWQVYSGLQAGTYNSNQLRVDTSHALMELEAGSQSSVYFAATIATGGDVNGDGRPDVLLSDWSHGGDKSGRAWLMLGGRW